MNRQMRKYDMKIIQGQEEENMKVNIQKVKDNWADLRGFL